MFKNSNGIAITDAPLCIAVELWLFEHHAKNSTASAAAVDDDGYIEYAEPHWYGECACVCVCIPNVFAYICLPNDAAGTHSSVNAVSGVKGK